MVLQVLIITLKETKRGNYEKEKNKYKNYNQTNR